VLNAPSHAAGEGLPFVFDRYVRLGQRGANLDALEAGAAWRRAGAARELRRDHPLQGQVVRFQ